MDLIRSKTTFSKFLWTHCLNLTCQIQTAHSTHTHTLIMVGMDFWIMCSPCCSSYAKDINRKSSQIMFSKCKLSKFVNWSMNYNVSLEEGVHSWHNFWNYTIILMNHVCSFLYWYWSVNLLFNWQRNGDPLAYLSGTQVAVERHTLKYGIGSTSNLFLPWWKYQFMLCIMA